MRLSTLLLWANAIIIGASPLQSRSQKSNIDSIEKEFPGIYWKLAADTCTDDQFDTLYRATKMSSTILQGAAPSNFGSKSTDGGFTEIYDTAAWNRYFLSPEKVHSRDPSYSWALNPTAYQTVIHNMQQAAFYPTQGGFGKSGETLQGKQVTYTCKDILNNCAKEANKLKTWTGPSATTIQPEHGENQVGGILVQFCPRFFSDEVEHIDDVVKGFKTANRRMSWNGIANLKIHEHTILHEWMHCNIFGYSPYNPDTFKTEAIIPDIKKSGLPGFADGVVMYGDDYAYKFARKYNANSKFGAANLETARNADSYALFYVYSYLNSEFDWSTDGSETVEKRDSGASETVVVDDDNYGNARDLSDLDEMTDPDNCSFDGTNSTLSVACVFEANYADLALSNNTDYECDTTRTSSVPAEIFGGMYSKFCAKVDEKSMLSWLVNYEGNEKFQLQKRTPPANPSDYKGVIGYLSFQKKDGDTKCSKSCSEAFEYLKACPCGTTGQGMYSMATEGSLDVGCGIYQFSGLENSQ
ncbi:uncharacterized protein N7511_004845 [Penicillium nucicola]|uniref:uncharacterized protein n=1 Tax=Penicillium nucicola TaxID=1850975 RepID=UPI002544E86D|nr:uncharacterized protein N7511_004845 [Penicillium nucicola]KAJ5767229.1 hypothetical protein N7511_004845 [Penicillium nucicola]